MDILRKLRIGHRLYLGFTVILLLFIALSFFTISKINFIYNVTSQLHAHPFIVTQAISDIDDNINYAIAAIREMISQKNLKGIEDRIKLFDGYTDKIYGDIDVLSSQFLGDKVMIKKLREQIDIWMETNQKIFSLMYSDNFVEADKVMDNILETNIKNVSDSQLYIRLFAKDKAGKFLLESEETKSHTINILYLLLFLFSVIAIVGASFLIRSFTVPIKALHKAVVAFCSSNGKDDIEIDIEGNDEIVHLITKYKQLTKKIHNLLEDLAQEKDKIKASLREKELLLAEIHHRVKNNMAVIVAILSMQKNLITDEKQIAIFNESEMRIRSMALIHEKLYMSKDFAKVDFKEYISNLLAGLFDTYKNLNENIHFTVDVKDVLLGIDMAVPCGLLINELLSNAIKYAFPNGKGGEIFVGMRKVSETDIELVVISLIKPTQIAPNYSQ